MKTLIATIIVIATIVVSGSAFSSDKVLTVEKVTVDVVGTTVIVKATHKGMIHCVAYDSNDRVISTMDWIVDSQYSTIPMLTKAAAVGCAYK